MGCGYIETHYVPKPMFDDYGQGYNSTYNYSRDLARWKQHCSDMRHAGWHNACEYKRRHWNGKKSKRKVKKGENMANIWDEFDKSIDTEGLTKDIEEAAENGGSYKEVPHDTYEVAINKLELTKSKKGDPMVTCWMKIVAGDYTNSLIFMNQVITQGFQIHIVNEFLRALVEEMEEPIEIEFKTYSQYGNLIMDVMEAIDNNFEYRVKYGERKGYNTFEIEEIYPLED